MADNNNDDENESNNNDGDKTPPSDRDVKARARAEARANRPGAVAVAADEVARLDQRIANKQRHEPGPTPASLNRLEQDVQAKSQASGGSGGANHQKPGAFSISKSSAASEPTKRSTSSPRKAHADLEALEDQIAAKTRAATAEAPGGRAALNSLEDRIQAKVRGEAASRMPHATAATPPSPPRAGAVMSVEERIQAKIRRDGGGSSAGGAAGTSALERLQDLEDRITAKQQHYDGSGPRTSRQNEVSRLDERIAAKNTSFGAPATSGSGNVDNLKSPPPASATVVPPAYLKKGDLHDSEPTSVDPMSKKADDYPDQGGEKVPIDEYNGGDPLANPHHGGSDLEYGVYDAAENPEGLAVAVPVMEENDDVFIPSAVEYDPDAKPPMYRNRRFRLYAYMAALVLALLLVGVGLGIHFAKDDEYDPTKAFAHREKLGIREAVENVVGAEKLEDETSPYSRALRWIMYHDPMELLPESPNFIQRYILAYLYHATSVERAWSSCNPPNEDQDDSCSWDQLWGSGEDGKRVQLSSFRWLSGVSECYWAGVFCDHFNQTRSIDHMGSDMTGRFPEGIVHLPYLQTVSLSFGSLSGNLPKEIGQMKHLASIDIVGNVFTGTVPEEWWVSRSLQRINVGTNRLTGKISEQIENMINIKRLYLSENLMTGTIPTVVGHLNSMSDFKVDTNFFQGTIPTEIGLFSALRSLWMHKNDLSGTLPTELGNCPSLERIRVANNARLTGEIPDEILPALTEFEAFNCNFYGNFTEKFLLMKEIRTLKIHNNRFGGTIPENLGKIMPHLIRMWISGNDFTGSVPESICDLAGFYTLSEMVADCAAPAGGTPEIFCPKGCCTECCNVAGENCL